MDPPPKRPSTATATATATSSSLFEVYLRLRPPPSPLVQLTQQSLYPNLPPPERWLTVEPPSPTTTTAATNASSSSSPSLFPLSSQAGDGDEVLKGEQPMQDPATVPTHITLNPPSDSRKRAVEKFAFTRVFEEQADQMDVFKGAGILPLVGGVLGEGRRDGLVATLGVTGSGKSHTILGSKTQRGLTQLALDLLYRSLGGQILHPAEQPSLVASLCATDASEAQIFSAATFLDNVYGEAGSSRAGTPMTDPHFTCNVPKRRLPQRPSALPQFPDISAMNVPIQANAEYTVLVSMYEVYNDRIFDLLTIPTNTKELRRRHLLFKSTEASPDRKVVAGLRKVVCGTYEEALMVLETGLHERRVAGTGSNSVSSRSHGFFVVEVKRRVKGGMSNLWSGATMTIVDLAGSERARTAKTAGATLAEAGKINESLMYLGQCLQMQSDQSQENGNKSSLVPFRQCKLTELLFSNSFPSSHHHHYHNHASQPVTHHHRNPQKAVMIVTADPIGDFNATSQILRYSALAREVTVPRIPSVSSTILAGIVSNAATETSSQARQRSASGSSQSEQAQQCADSEMVEMAFSEIARLNEDVEILNVRLEEEEGRRREAEENWQRAEEQAERIEMEVREECWGGMEQKLSEERRRWVAAWGEETDRNEEHLDRKIELLSQSQSHGGRRSVMIHEDAEDVNAYTQRLERENDALRRRVEMLEREIQCRSPTKSKARVSKQQVSMLDSGSGSGGSINDGDDAGGKKEEESVLRSSLFKLNAMSLGGNGEREGSLGGREEEEEKEVDEGEGEMMMRVAAASEKVVNATTTTTITGTPGRQSKGKSMSGSESGRKVRKLTARKWDLMDENEMEGYGVF